MSYGLLNLTIGDGGDTQHTHAAFRLRYIYLLHRHGDISTCSIRLRTLSHIEHYEPYTEKETRLYISSLHPDDELINRAVRSHWSVENSLHWVLDVAFNEDHSRKKAGNAAQNFSMLNRIALNLIKNEKSVKVGVKGKRLKAGWDNGYLSKLLKI